jgi:hypothetical protein
MLRWDTVNNLLKDTLLTLMQAEELKEFRLVGGTALSLHLGHRLSIDIDLFTDAPYVSIDFESIEDLLTNNFAHVQGNFGGNAGLGKSYLVGTDPDNVVKVDIYYSNDPFFQELTDQEGVRMATVQEIVAMKIDMLLVGPRKKDFWDLHELLDHYSISEMINIHGQRYEWTHNEVLIIQKFTDFTHADDDLDPICLKKKEWVFIKEDIVAAVEA